MSEQVAGADDPRGWRDLAVAVAVLALVSSLTGLGNGFAYDDRWIIVENKNVHSLHQFWNLFQGTYWPNTASLYRPLTILLYAIQWAIGGGKPFVFHLVNVALYTTVSVLVLWLAVQVLSRPGAFVAGALFAVHPVHVEAVGNVVGQAELWTAVVIVASTALYLRDRRHGLPLQRQTGLAIVALYMLGMLIKENTIVLPAILLTAEFLVVRDPRGWRTRADETFTLLAWMGLCAALFLWVRIDVLGELGGDTEHPSLHNLTMLPRTLIMVGLAPEFARLFVWPANLYADYSPQAVSVHAVPHIDQIPGVLLLLCCAILLAVSWRRFPPVAFGLAWIAIAIAPVANVLLPTGILIAERTLLVPSVGVVLAAGYATPWLLRQLVTVQRSMRLAAYGAFAALVVAGASWSAERQHAWHDSHTVFQTLADDAPMSFKAHYALGGQLFEEKRAMDAEREWRVAIALFPEYHGVYADLGHKYKEAHLCEAANVLYRKALAIEPELPIVRAQMVACYLELAQFHRARSEARSAIGAGAYRRAFLFMIERADSALTKNDSIDGTIRWSGRSTILKPR